MGQQIVVMGLGAFGGLVARELTEMGHEVLGCDRDPLVVAEAAPRLTQAIELDATDIDALRAIGPGDFDVAIVALDRQSTILATMLLEQLGVPATHARAQTDLDAEILRRIGADRVLMTDRQMAAWVARTIDLAGALDFIRLSAGIGAVHLAIPDRLVGASVAELHAARPTLRIVAIRRGDDVITDPPDDARLAAGDSVLVVGPEAEFRALANQ
jgi:trk system potassium uptake protein TrkA